MATEKINEPVINPVESPVPYIPRFNPDGLTPNQRFVRWSTKGCGIDSSFPARPTAEQITKEYTPDRIMRLARYVARTRSTLKNTEQYEEDVAQCVFSIMTRIDQYVSGQARIGDTYKFYHWLLFHVRTDLRDARRRENRPLNGRQIVRLTEGTPAPESVLPDDKIDLEDAKKVLTPKQAQVVQAIYVDGKGQQEVADEMGMSQVAVSRLLTRGLKRMKDYLGGEK